MPQEPKKRHSRARQGKRRAAIHLKLQKGTKCPNCGSITMPHTMCKNCGYYKGRVVVVKKSKKEKGKEEKKSES